MHRGNQKLVILHKVVLSYPPNTQLRPSTTTMQREKHSGTACAQNMTLDTLHLAIIPGPSIRDLHTTSKAFPTPLPVVLIPPNPQPPQKNKKDGSSGHQGTCRDDLFFFPFPFFYLYLLLSFFLLPLLLAHLLLNKSRALLSLDSVPSLNSERWRPI